MTLQTIPAWSISALLEYEQCPHRAYLRRIVRAPQPDLPTDHPMIRGQRVHKEVENYINGSTDEFPSAGKKMKPVLDRCRELYQEGIVTVEEQWGFTKDWIPTGWWDDDVWCRMATDCKIEHAEDALELHDWKTGKSYGNEVKYMQQMQLYAIGAFMRYPKVNYADVKLGFLDEGITREKNFERGPKINKLIARFSERGHRMTSAVDFRPKPNAMNCKYCPFGPGGTDVCVHGVSPL